MDENEVIQADTTDEASNSSEDGFLDAFSEQSETPEEVNEEPEVEAEAIPEAEAKHKIRVDHKDIELTLDELKANAQKGMAFDRLKSDYDAKRAIADKITAVAEKHGKTVDELILQAEEGYVSLQFENLKNGYIEQGYDEEIAETLANKDIEISNAKKTEPAAPTAEQLKQQRDIALFNELYPDMTVNDIPDEVFADIEKKGLTLLEAYQRYENAELKKQAEALKQNYKNAKSTLGSAKDNKQQLKKDDFLSEFMKE